MSELRERPNGAVTSATQLPASLAQKDLLPRGAVVLAFVAMTAITLLDLTDGKLGFVFSLGFVLIAVTVPIAVDVRAMLTAGVLPPALLVLSLFFVAIVSPGAIDLEGLPKDVGVLGRTLAGVIDHGVTLVVGYGIALVAIMLRMATAPEPVEA